jgi:sugar lactone lactonase YvrE
MGVRSFVKGWAAAPQAGPCAVCLASRRSKMLMATFLSLPLLSLACADGGASADAWTGTVDTLASGTILVRNGQQGAWGEEAPWQDLSVDLRLGKASGDGPELFGDIRDIEVDSLGRIYVLDSQAGEIRVFQPDGAYLRTIGRSGQGPGELQGPTGIEWGPGHRLWVEDTRNSRYSVFDTAGAFITSFPRKSNWFGYAWSGRFDDEGFLYLEQHQFAPEGRVDRLAKLDTSMAALDSFPLPSFDAPAYELKQDGLVRMAATIPYTARLVWTVAPDGTVWFGITDEYRLYQRSLEGDTLRIVEKAHDPLPVTTEERESALEPEFYQDMREQGADIDPNRIPDHHPAWKGFSVGPDGYLWVVPETADSTTAIDVFEPTGRYLGRLELDAMIRPLYPGPLVRGNRLYGIAQDELGVSYVIRAPLGVELPAD